MANMAFLDSVAAAVSGEPLKIVLVTIPGSLAALAKEAIDRLEKRAVVAKPDPHYQSALEGRLRAEIKTVNRWRLSSYVLILTHALLALFVLPSAKSDTITWDGLHWMQKGAAVVLAFGGAWLLIGGVVVARAACRMRPGGSLDSGRPR